MVSSGYRTNAPRRHRRRRGFTLLEVLLVVGILVALGAMVVPSLIGVGESANADNAQIQVDNLDRAVALYQSRVGTFPTTSQGLQALVTAPNPKPKKWNGPYLETANEPDPWGNPFNYRYPGDKNQHLKKPDIWSNGPDGQSGTEDDIGNWRTEQ